MSINQDFKKKFLVGSAAATIGQSASMVFHFLSIMILTRFISKEDFGIYAIILVINYLLIILGTLGLDMALVKYLSSDNTDERKSVFVPVLLFRSFMLLFLSVLLYALGSHILPLIDERILNFSNYIIILFIFSSFRDFFYRALQGLSLFKKYAIIQVSSAVLRVLLLIVLLSLEVLTLKNLIIIEILTVILTDIIGLYFIPIKRLFKGKFSRAGIQSIIKFSYPQYINQVLYFLYRRMNLFIIGILLNPVSVAFYEVAFKLPEAINKLFHSFILVYFPNISNLLSKGDEKSAEILMNKSLRIISVIIATSALISFLFKNEIIVIIFSDRYIDSALAFSLLMIHLNIAVLEHILGYSVLATGNSLVPMKVNIVSSLISITGSLLLIPIVGFIGAVYALIIMSSVAHLLYLLFLKRADISPDIKEYLKPTGILFGSIVIFLALNTNSLFVKIIIVFLYVGFMWMFVYEFRNLVRILIKTKSYITKRRVK